MNSPPLPKNSTSGAAVSRQPSPVAYQPLPLPPFDVKTPIGILDTEAKRQNPLTNRPYQNPEMYRGESGNWSTLGVFTNRHHILETMHTHQMVCAKSGTGSGKTVLFPKFALHVLGYKGKVLCAIPKKVNARESAVYAAKCLDVAVGDEVGYMYRGTTNASPKTLLTFTTTGSANALIKRDDTLSDYDYLIIDEAHERKPEMDMLLALLKDVVRKRPTLRVIIMSATIDPVFYEKYFTKGANPPSFAKLEIKGAPPRPRINIFSRDEGTADLTNATVLENKLVGAIARILNERPLARDLHVRKQIASEYTNSNQKDASITDGDILAFVPSGTLGLKVIRKLESMRAQNPHWENFFGTKLEARSTHISTPPDAHGRTIYNTDGKPVTEKDLAIDPVLYKTVLVPPRGKGPYTRKIVLSTNVAESSLTVKGVTYVIDPGVAISSEYVSNRMLDKTEYAMVAQDSIIQREGRVGRTSPGVAYHLYTQAQFNRLDKITRPEILTYDLTSTVLEVMSMPGRDSVSHVRSFLEDMFDPPSETSIQSALRTLHSVGAITSTQPSGTRNLFGRAMSIFRSPITVCQSKSLLLSVYYNCSREMADIVALCQALQGRSLPDKMLDDNRKPVHTRLLSKFGDHLTMLHAYQQYTTSRDKYHFCRKHNLKFSFFENIDKESSKILNSLNTLFERDDDLRNADPSLIIDECTDMGFNMSKSRTKHSSSPTSARRQLPNTSPRAHFKAMRDRDQKHRGSH